MDIKHFFTDEQRLALQNCIAEAEKQTSGEIRVHLDKHCKDDVLETAAKRFESLKMHQTAERNGVLIYLSPTDKKVAIIGDKGINEKVPEGFWDNVYLLMKNHFVDGLFFEGLKLAIEMSGEKLKLYFPYQHNDDNELHNDISYGE